MVKRLLTIAALMVGFGLAGCIVVVDDKNKRRNNDGGGSGGADTTTSDSSGGYDDGGASASHGHDHDAEPAPSREPEQRRYYVYGYRDAYRGLPEMGETKDYFRAHGNLAQVDRGYYYGDWHCGAQGMIKEGAGQGETVIDGHLEIKGDNWVLRNITVTGDVKIRGSNNDCSGLEVFGRYDVRGTGNRTSQ